MVAEEAGHLGILAAVRTGLQVASQCSLFRLCAAGFVNQPEGALM
jgi:hypothetical protein